MATHLRCRCAEIPATRRWAELGIKGVPEMRLAVRRGLDLFARLPEKRQRQVLGPAKFAAFKAGAIELYSVDGGERQVGEDAVSNADWSMVEAVS